MTARTARAVSLGLLGGIAALLFISQGLLYWAGLIAWASFLELGGDTAALKKTIAGNLFGAFMGWVALIVTVLIPASASGESWLLKAGVVDAVALVLVVLATRFEMLSRVSTSLYGFAAVIGAVVLSVALENVSGLEQLTGFHHFNPFLLVVASMILGAVFGLASNKLAEALTKK
jgi:hypothetical protein